MIYIIDILINLLTGGCDITKENRCIIYKIKEGIVKELFISENTYYDKNMYYIYDYYFLNKLIEYDNKNCVMVLSKIYYTLNEAINSKAIIELNSVNKVFKIYISIFDNYCYNSETIQFCYYIGIIIFYISLIFLISYIIYKIYNIIKNRNNYIIID